MNDLYALADAGSHVSFVESWPTCVAKPYSVVGGTLVSNGAGRESDVREKLQVNRVADSLRRAVLHTRPKYVRDV